jgi:putative tricarboxylic transport membrane protein
MIELSLKGGTVSGKDSPTMKVTGVWEGIVAPIKHWDVLLRGSLIGTLIGAVPGLGGTVAAFLSYSSTAQSDKDPDSFGKGNIRGVIAPESANNAKDGGSLIPTVAFGIPGSAETAIFLAILVLHGMSPGPQILIENEREIYGLIVAMTISCVLASVIGLLLTRWIVLITFINVRIIVPIVVSVALTGVYVLEGRMAEAGATIIANRALALSRLAAAPEGIVITPRETEVAAAPEGWLDEQADPSLRLPEVTPDSRPQAD